MVKTNMVGRITRNDTIQPASTNLLNVPRIQLKKKHDSQGALREDLKKEDGTETKCICEKEQEHLTRMCQRQKSQIQM